MEQARQGVREPRQQRSRRTLSRILAAARKLLVEDGVDAVTVQAVVVKAGASVGSFYARFSGKDDLLEHLQGAVWEEVLAWWEETAARQPWDGLPLEQTLATAVRLLRESREAFGPERRALGSRPEGLEAERRFERRVTESLGERILSHQKEIRHPKPQVAVDFGLLASMGVLRSLADRGGPGAPDPAAIDAELARLLLAYLAGGSPPANAAIGHGVDPFDVWGD